MLWSTPFIKIIFIYLCLILNSGSSAKTASKKGTTKTSMKISWDFSTKLKSVVPNLKHETTKMMKIKCNPLKKSKTQDDLTKLVDYSAEM
ncbi:hypothetical protein NUSPORA_01136 [Nucleospora cyclopteri]